MRAPPPLLARNEAQGSAALRRVTLDGGCDQLDARLLNQKEARRALLVHEEVPAGQEEDPLSGGVS